MRMFFCFPALVGIASIGCITGCDRPDTIAKGIIYQAEYQLPGGGTYGFTRVNNNRCVPSGSGDWNIDAYGQLTRDFLIIENRKHPKLGPEYIAVSRLVCVQFGDGGIAEVEKQTNPGR